MLSDITAKTKIGTLVTFQIKDKISKRITKITYFRGLTEELQNMIRETYMIPKTKKKSHDIVTSSKEIRI